MRELETQIYDIDKQDISQIDKSTIFALDTNVLYWTHYSRASDPNLKAHPYQVTKYPNFVDELLENGNELVTTVINLTELMHVIENSEFKIYKAINKKKINKKDFRKLIAERDKYKKEIEKVLLEINSSYAGKIKCIDIDIDDINKFILNADNNTCDVFDYCVIEYLRGIGITNFITDDRDFHSVDGINIFCANE